MCLFGIFGARLPWAPTPLSPNYYKLKSALKQHRSDFPGGPLVKKPPAHAGDKDVIPGLGRSHVPQGNRACVPQEKPLQREARPPDQRKPTLSNQGPVQPKIHTYINTFKKL